MYNPPPPLLFWYINSNYSCYFFFYLQIGGASYWRVCYQRGRPRLVNTLLTHYYSFILCKKYLQNTVTPKPFSPFGFRKGKTGNFIIPSSERHLVFGRIFSILGIEKTLNTGIAKLQIFQFLPYLGHTSAYLWHILRKYWANIVHILGISCQKVQKGV